ncbi:hypothetical protein FRC03_005692 [Tulasnella sp. 419]|nr:hypothetical protein FRC03_005692 [Tulasnella sp. 419]
MDYSQVRAFAPSSSHNFHASPQLQAQMYDVASNFPPPRKQNIACDACRSRKVKCHQLPGSDKCQHCLSKNYPCTHFVQAATSEKRRSSNVNSRKNRNTTNTNSASGGESSNVSGQNPSRALLQGSAPSPNSTLPSSVSPSPGPLSSSPPPSSSGNPTLQLLQWLFTPSPSVPPANVRGNSTYRAMGLGEFGLEQKQEDWGPEILNKLSGEAFRVEFALDLIEVYMQICHTRSPVLDPADFRARFKASIPPSLLPPTSPSSPALPTKFRPLPASWIAIVLGWGSKFSEHPLLVLDRREHNGRSIISRSLVKKAIEVAEAEKAYRTATPEAVLTCMIIEGIQSHKKDDPDRFNCFWIHSAIKLMQELGVNKKSVMYDASNADDSPFGDGPRPSSLVFCWWVACLSDAVGSAYLKKKPALDDDDYDTKDFLNAHYPPDPVLPAGVQAAYLSWYASLHALARITRQMCRTLWVPSSELDGIPYESAMTLISLFSQWREEHLDKVGVPSNFEADWDFVAAVTACSSDAMYHTMWIIMAQAVEESGIKEHNDIFRSGTDVNPTQVAEFEAVKNKLAEEALHGSLRIAGLAGVLTSNGYLRLDPNTLHYSTYVAGLLLARSGRPEVVNCIQGLKQYGLAYEDALDQAAELEHIYAITSAAIRNHVYSQSPVTPQNHQGSFGGPQSLLSSEQAQPTPDMTIPFNGSPYSDPSPFINSPVSPLQSTYTHSIYP